MEFTGPPIVTLEGEIMTNSHGINKLMQFYFDASQYNNSQVIVDCYQLSWLDANLTAFLSALGYRLKKERGIQLAADFDFLSKKFGVFFRNGWLQDADYNIPDLQETTLPCMSFDVSMEDEFCDYVKEKLLCHRGMPDFTESLRLRIQTDLAEICTNIGRHARTSEPFFVCGQFYPKFNYFVFSMVDLGVGFLPPIQTFTDNLINSDIEAINWALEGNSTTGEPLAGTGLNGIYDYFKTHEGGLQIFTGNAFWGTDLKSTIWQGYRPLKHSFKGSMLNLFFPCKREK